MKNLFFLLLLLTVPSCKKKEISEQTTPLDNIDLTKTFGLESFLVEGVPESNIRFTKLGTDYPFIIVTLPANYQNGDSIKITSKMPDGIFLRPELDQKNETGKFTLKYEGEYIHLVVSDVSKILKNNISVLVQPSVPLKIGSTGNAYEYTINGKDQYLKLSIENWGTEAGVTGKDSLMSNGKISIKNKKTGAVFSSVAGYRVGEADNLLKLNLPVDAEAGDYEMTLQKDNRTLVLPNKLMVKYGQPLVKMGDRWNKYSYEGKNTISYQGLNMTDSHIYELQLKNDFSEPSIIKLSAINRFTIQGKLPSGFSQGNYEMKLLIDGKEVNTNYNIENHALLLAKKDSIQPAILVLSQPKEMITNGLFMYRAITSFDRTQPVITWPEASTSKSYVVLKNIETGQIFNQAYTGYTTSTIPFPYFTITPEIPNGRYEARLSTESQSDTGLLFISERYNKIITIY